MKRLSLAALVVAGALVGLLVLLHALASPRETIVEPIAPSSHKRLVVMVHALSGRAAFEPAVATAREALPDSDFLVFDYDAGLLSNADPYDIANRIETAIHEATQNKRYERIVLIGHSLGGMLLRKTLLWGHGLEQDRSARKGARQWVDQVERFVSLAAVNRGWSVDPAPEKMGLSRYLAIVIGERLARWSMSGRLLLAMQRGAPFVADARLQWIDLARDPARRLPQTIHLLGDQDDIVSRRDAADIGVAKNTVFVTLPQTDHAGIASALQGDASPAGVERRSRIVAAMRGEIDKLDSDRDQELAEDPTVTRLVFVMHGIRDYGDWSDHLRDAIEREARSSSERTAVVAAKYGHFPMLPFLLYWDRQRNVRWFMDELTQNKARYPKLRTIDYVGHSNGTYILASALAHYQSIRVDRVYFAGSVVPKHYDCRTLIDSGRVGQVANVVAADDWVVALFPRLFEQIAEWAKRKPRDGPLDVGSAGFRGFDASQDPSEKISNYKFADGGHGIGVDTRAEQTVEAIARFVVHADSKGLEAFKQRDEPAGGLDLLSNVSWAVWLLLAVILVGIGRVLFKRSPRATAWYAAIVLALLYSL
jgi:pimeloyl-ACP methyl ester carboxylesterase